MTPTQSPLKRDITTLITIDFYKMLERKKTLKMPKLWPLLRRKKLMPLRPKPHLPSHKRLKH
jgi:hypothetical protein